MARAADRAGIQFRMLNASKGPAVRATRAQADRALYAQAIRALLENQPNLRAVPAGGRRPRRRGRPRARRRDRDSACEFAARARRADGRHLPRRAHPRRPEQHAGGRAGDPPSNGSPRGCASCRSRVGRLKTGTPPRIDGRTIDYLGTRGAARRRAACRCSRSSAGAASTRGRCPATSPRTNERTHEIIRGGLDRSPMYTGADRGRRPALLPVGRGQGRALRRAELAPDLPRAGGPRHATRSTRTASRPACRSTCRSSFVRTHPGLRERAHHAPGYAIEYDYFDPRELKPTLRDQRRRGPVLRRPDQRHHRLRGGRRAGPGRRHQRGAAALGAPALVPRSAARPTSACWSTTWSRAAPPSRTGCSPAAPSTACCCARTTPTCG